MRIAHESASFRAVSVRDALAYDGVMKTSHFMYHRADNTLRDERRPTAFHNPHAVARKALERWENEGGKIPELAFAIGSDAPERITRSRAWARRLERYGR